MAGASQGEIRWVRAPFEGRERERQLLEGVVTASHGGRGALVLIGGEPGIGKTRLTEELVESARASVITAVASCPPDEQPPFHVWRRALRDAAAAVDSRSPTGQALHAAREAMGREAGLSSAAMGDDRLSLYEEVREHLSTMGPAPPVVLVLDDLHWADHSSLGLLGYLQPDLGRLPFVVVGTYRPEEILGTHPLRRVLEQRVGEVHRIELVGLSPADIAAVAASYAGLDAHDLDGVALCATTGGNPLFARELARLLGDGVASHHHEAVPDSVRAVIERRLAHIEDSPDVLEILAVEPRPAAADALAEMAGIATAAALEMLSSYEHAGLLGVEPPDAWDFTHGLIRQTVYESLGAARRAELHRRAAERVEGTATGSPRDLAHHLRRAMPLVTAERAALAARRAGEQALAEMAYEEAARHLVDARALGASGDPADHTELLLQLGEARFRSGDRVGAEEAFESAIDVARRTGRADHLSRAALGFGAGAGGFEVAPFDDRQVAVLRDALDALDDAGSPLWTRLTARLSVAGAAEIGVDEQRRLADEALTAARRLGQPGLLAYVLSTHCDAYAGPDHVDQRLAHSGEMLSLASQSRDREMELLARRLRVVAHLERGDHRAAQADMDAFARVAGRLDDPLYGWYVPHFAATMAAAAGDFRRATDLWQQSVEVGCRAGSFNAELLNSVQRANLQLLESPSASAAAAFVDMIDGYDGASRDPAVNIVTAAVSAMCGDVETARERFARASRDGFRIRFDSEWLGTTAIGVAAAVVLEDHDAARELRARLLPYAHLFYVDGIAAGLFGSIAGWIAPATELLGDHTRAAEERKAAIAANLAAGLPGVAKNIERFGTPWSSADDVDLPRIPVERAGQPEPSAPRLRRTGEQWELAFQGTTVSVRDSKGMRDLAVLVARPGREVAAIDLASPERAPIERVVDRSIDDVLDAPARAAYRDRIVELQGELDDADAHNDPERSIRAQVELDLLVQELAAATGLGGRPRRTGSDSERARKAVSGRISDALRRLANVHPEAARHLRHSVRTGTYCCYEPEQLVTWDVQP